MAYTRSTTGCFACKTRRKKCDETKPHCLRCQKSYIKCPGYTYIQDPNRPFRKPRTLLAPRTVGRSRSRAPAVQGNAEELGTQLQEQLSLGNGMMTSSTPHNVPGTSLAANPGTLSGHITTSCPLASSPSVGPLPHSSIDLHITDRLEVSARNPDGADPVQTLPAIGAAKSMTFGQASLIAALLSLGPAANVDPPQKHAQPATNRGGLLLPSRTAPGAQTQDEPAAHEDDDPEGITSVIRHELVLDKTTESNALPFVLQGYATWVRRVALEPQKVMRIGRDFVFSHFDDGEQSRWIVVLLANVGSKIGNTELVDARPNPMLCALQTAVRRRLKAVKSHPNPTRSELTKALDPILETILIHFYTSPISEAVILRQEAAPIFRLLCPGPPNVPIDLSTILRQPAGSLARFAMMDITFSLATDMPTLLQYEAAIPGMQISDPFRSVPKIPDDGIVQWMHGFPNQLMLAFAKMMSIRANESKPSQGVIASAERELYEISPYNGSSSDRFLAVMRSVVQECWRQVAFVYLYMAVCGDSNDTPRVKESFKRFMKLLNGTIPGRLPDEFLTLPLVVISPAAQRKRDRQVIMQRILGLESFRPNNNVICIVEDCWARTDDEKRPTLWSDVAVSRRKVLSEGQSS